MKKKCTVENCDNPVLCSGLCNKHYLRLKRNNTLNRKTQERGEQCSVVGCTEKVYAQNLCNKHWARKRKYGSTERDVLIQPWRGKETLLQYLENRSVLNKETGCIEWTNHLDDKGYGSAWHRGKPMAASRLSYIAHNGKVPKGLQVCHHCDNRKCINIEHLYAGTAKDNARDRVERGRSNTLVGEEAYTAKVTEKQAIEIIKRRSKGERAEDIAPDYGISHWSVYDIYRGKSWKNLDRNKILNPVSRRRKRKQ